MTHHLIPFRRGLPGDDPIFLLNAEAQRRRAAGEEVVNATVGALLDDAGRLVVLDSVMALWRELGEIVPQPLGRCLAHAPGVDMRVSSWTAEGVRWRS